MSDQPEKSHAWAKFRAPPVAARPRLRTGAPALPVAKPAARPTVPGTGAAPDGQVGRETAAERNAESAGRGTKAERPKGGPWAMPVRPASKPPAAEPGPETVTGPGRTDEALAAAALAEVEVAAGEAVAAARRERLRRQPWWVLIAVRDSMRDWRETKAALTAWWRDWRGSAAARTLLAFAVLYGFLAVMRAPSPVAVERSRQREDAAFLQGFLKDFCTRGGTVFARKPHGGSELYPRGVLLQGEALEAFQRTPVGGVFVLKPGAQGWNPLAGFYGFPSIYVGGAYFHLERPFNFARFRCAFLIRKDSERAGAMLVARVEAAY